MKGRFGGDEIAQRVFVGGIFFAASIAGFIWVLAAPTTSLTSGDVINCCFAFDGILGAMLGIIYTINNRNDSRNLAREMIKYNSVMKDDNKDAIEFDPVGERQPNPLLLQPPPLQYQPYQQIPVASASAPPGGALVPAAAASGIGAGAGVAFSIEGAQPGKAPLIGGKPAILPFSISKQILLSAIHSSDAWFVCWVFKGAASLVLVGVCLGEMEASSGSILFIFVTYFATISGVIGCLIAVRDYLRKERAERFGLGDPKSDLTSVAWGSHKGRIAIWSIVLAAAIGFFIGAVIFSHLSKADLVNAIFAELSVIGSTLGILFVLHNRTDADLYRKL